MEKNPMPRHSKTPFMIVSPLRRPTKSRHTFPGEDFFDPADDAAGQAHLDSVGMGGRLCENILDDSFRQSAGALVLFSDNLDQSSRFNINPVFSIHFGFHLYIFNSLPTTPAANLPPRESNDPALNYQVCIFGGHYEICRRRIGAAWCNKGSGSARYAGRSQ